jgi:hypothetical protein
MTILQTKVEAAFRKLPIAPPVGPGIPYDTLIPRIAHELSWMRPIGRNVASERKAIRKLITLKKKAHVLSGDMSTMVQLPLSPLSVSATADMEIPQLPQPLRGGAPKKDLAALVARRVAEHYFHLTGKRPTRITPPGGGKARGPFIELLTAIYEILGIKASAENQTKELAKHFDGGI